MVTRGSPKPLLRVRILLPLPTKASALCGGFCCISNGRFERSGSEWQHGGLSEPDLLFRRKGELQKASALCGGFCFPDFLLAYVSEDFRSFLFSYITLSARSKTEATQESFPLSYFAIPQAITMSPVQNASWLCFAMMPSRSSI